jgi:hypothetical protein
MRNTDYTEFLKMSPDELRKLQKSRGWALSAVGTLVYWVLRLFGCKPKRYYGICEYFEVGKSRSGMEMGWFFVCGKGCSDTLKNHEVGHNIQNAAVGGLKMAFLSIGSFFRFWWRKIFRIKTPYDSWWFEGQATDLGTKYAEYWKGESNDV